MLFTIIRTADGETGETSQLAVLDLESGESRVLLNGGTHPRYLASGHLVYSVGDTLRAVGFDADRLEVAGDPVPVLEGVMTPLDGGANVDISDTGTLVYQRGGAVSGRALVWVDRDGREAPLAAELRDYGALRISPDGQRAAIVVAEPDEDILVYDLARDTPTRLTFTPDRDGFPVWSPEGDRIVFASDRDGGAMNLYSKAADGTGAVERLTTSGTDQYSSSWSADGDTFVFVEGAFGADTEFDVTALSMNGEPAAAPVLHTEFTEWYAELSPDGRWMAYGSNESGQNEIYVRPFPNVDDGKWQISRGGPGHNLPLWGPDGRELFYRRFQDGAMMVVAIDTDPTFSPGNPAVLFEARSYLPSGGARAFDIHPDGQRFLMIKQGAAAGDESPPPDIVVVEHWMDEVVRRMLAP